MIHATVELPQCKVEVRNDDQAVVFSRDSSELLRLSFRDFEEVLELVAKSQSFFPE